MTKKYFNTSNVDIKQNPKIVDKKNASHFNTSNVDIKLTQI